MSLHEEFAKEAQAAARLRVERDQLRTELAEARAEVYEQSQAYEEENHRLAMDNARLRASLADARATLTAVKCVDGVKCNSPLCAAVRKRLAAINAILAPAAEKEDGR